MCDKTTTPFTSNNTKPTKIDRQQQEKRIKDSTSTSLFGKNRENHYSTNTHSLTRTKTNTPNVCNITKDNLNIFGNFDVRILDGWKDKTNSNDSNKTKTATIIW